MNGNIKRWSKIGAIIFFLGMLMAVLAGCASSTKAVKETQKDTGQVFEPKHITGISASEDLTSSHIWIKGNQLLTYTSVKQTFPLGVLLYFPETVLGDIDTSYVPDSDIVSSIKASELTTKGHTSRVEILLKKDASYEVTREDTGLKISFSKESVSTDEKLKIIETSSHTAQNVEKPPAASEQRKLDAKPTANKTVTPQIKKHKRAWINRIDFSGEEGGKSTIIIGTTIPIT
ncbi:MAG: hypothetical protein PVG86_02915, partial [Desulfobacterales bacterium]